MCCKRCLVRVKKEHKVEETNEQEKAPNSGEHTSQMSPIHLELPMASFHLPSGSFICSDKACSHSKVLITEGQNS